MYMCVVVGTFLGIHVRIRVLLWVHFWVSVCVYMCVVVGTFLGIRVCICVLFWVHFWVYVCVYVCCCGYISGYSCAYLCVKKGTAT